MGRYNGRPARRALDAPDDVDRPLDTVEVGSGDFVELPAVRRIRGRRRSRRGALVTATFAFGLVLGVSLQLMGISVGGLGRADSAATRIPDPNPPASLIPPSSAVTSPPGKVTDEPTGQVDQSRPTSPASQTSNASATPTATQPSSQSSRVATTTAPKPSGSATAPPSDQPSDSPTAGATSAEVPDSSTVSPMPPPTDPTTTATTTTQAPAQIQPSARPAPRTPQPAPCAPGQLTVSALDRTSESPLVTVEVRNSGASPCSVKGPVVAWLIAADGSRIGAKSVLKPGADGNRTARLAASGTATAQIEVSDAEERNPKSCSPKTATGLVVQLPQAKAAGHLAWSGLVGCSSPSVPLLQTTPLGG